MATFQTQVEGLTGLTVEITPTAAELSQFLIDGVMDVTQRLILANPANTEMFIRGSSTTSSNGIDIGGAQVISVIRESEADGDTDGSTAWRECRKVSTALRSRVVDIDSLDYASKYNPVYIINNNGAVNVYPVPDGTNDGYRVYYVNNEPKGDGVADTLAAGHSAIGFFPNDKEYLVVLYASVKSLENALATKSSELPSDVIFSAPELETISSMILPSVPDAPELSDNSVTFSEIAPSFDEPVVTPDFTDANYWVNVEEDEEMLRARMSVINAELQQYQADIQKSVQKMNNENLEYQAKLQTAIQDAQLSSQDDAQALQKYSADLNKYQAEVTKEVQRWTNEEYNTKFNKWQQEYQGSLQEYGTNVQNYNTKVQKITADYQWMENRMKKLQQEYDAAFMLMQPKQQGGK